MSAKRVCRDCPAIIPTNAYKGRCPSCSRQADRARGTKTERGYGPDFVAERKAWQRRLNQGMRVTCWRCDDPIDPEHWHLGHDDTDRGVVRGPECPSCNLSAAGRSSHV